MALSQLIYSSRNRSAGRERAQLETLRSIVSVSQRNNQRDGLTGFLIFDQAHFFQILEGERSRVLASYARIRQDPRHADVSLMALRDVRERGFPQWSMGGIMRSLDQQEIFLRHGIADRIDPARITAPTILGLAVDLQAFELARKQDLRAAS